MKNFMVWFLFAAVAALAIMQPILRSQAEQAGYEKGLAAGQAECQQQTIDELTVLITSSQYLVSKAHDVSQQLTTSTTARVQADQKSTQELSDALALTADERAQCRFDDDSMRHTAAARDRAAEAAAGGLGGAVPAAGGDE